MGAPSLTAVGWGVERPPGGNPSGELDLASYGRILAKNLWILAGAVVAALALAGAVTLLAAPIYTAQATLQIDREGGKVVSAGDVFPTEMLTSDDEFFQTQYGLLRSRSLAERVSRTLGLARGDAFIKRMEGGRPRPFSSPSAREQKVVDLLEKNLDVVPTRGSRLVRIGFSSRDPELSALVANAFADDFIAGGLDRRFEASAYARAFLERRLAEVKARLEASERALVAYAASHEIIPLAPAARSNNPDVGQSLTGANLEAFNTALAGAKTERIRGEERWRLAQRTGGGDLPEVLQSPTIQQITQDRAKLAADYQDKLSVFKPDYPDMVELKARIVETDRQLALQSDAVRQSLHAQYDAAAANERALAGEVDSLKAAVLDLRARSIQYTILQREADTNRALYDGLLQRYKEVAVAGGVAASNVAVIDSARPPLHPSRPKPLLNLLIGGLAGAVIGVGLAFGREALDQAVHTPEEVEAELGLTLLGTVPPLKGGAPPSTALADARSPLAEAYQSLCSTLRLSSPGGFPASLLITSPWPGGGKSTTALAIARNQARLGFRVLLIDADLRSPSLHAMAGADNREGLGAVLTGAARLEGAIQPTAQADLFLLPAGPPPPNPAELLAGGRFAAVIAEAAAAFDLVICDGPPIMGLADAPLIGAAAAGTLVVIEAGRTGRSHARSALRRLGMAGCRVLGAVLTRFESPRGDYDYGYGGGRFPA